MDPKELSSKMISLAGQVEVAIEQRNAVSIGMVARQLELLADECKRAAVTFDQAMPQLDVR